MSNELSLSLIAGINLKRLIRSSRYRTQENFAYEFGAEIRTVSRWLNAGVKNIDTLEEIADFLEVDVFELLKKKDDIVSLGAKESKALGINYKANMGILIGIATLLTAGAVSVSGTIGWIGLVIPNVVRLIVGSDNNKVLPLSMLSGAAFMIIVDMLARTLAPNEIPLSVITGIIGTPLFIYAIFKRRKELQ